MTTGFTLSMRIARHAAVLTGRALARRWPWLFVAPAVSLVVELLAAPIAKLGILGGFLMGFLIAAATSLVLFVGRGIIENRRFSPDDLQRGLGAFFGDVLNVLFLVWIATLVASAVPPLLVAIWAALVLLPVFEVVALAPVGGFGAFPAAWHFFRRDFGPWLLGQLPVVALFIAWFSLESLAMRTLEGSVVSGFGLRITTLALGRLNFLVAFAAFIYRGVLFLTLDGIAPHARASRFGSRRASPT